ncbi:MAG: 30S ribosomal protein S6 [Anaerolineales bacterium]|nr:30S ribosomal protein S6 [Anaerolineales bacterium]
MRKYELALIVHPDALPETVGEIAETLTEVITEAGGGVQRAGQLANAKGNIVERPDGDWQQSKLAYPIKKETEGYYVILEIQTTPDVLPAIERNLRLNESVIRQLLVRRDE